MDKNLTDVPSFEKIRSATIFVFPYLTPLETEEKAKEIEKLIKVIHYSGHEWICKCERKHGFTLVAGYSYCNQCGKRC